MRPHQREIGIIIMDKSLTKEEKISIAKNNLTALELQRELMQFELLDFLGIAQLLEINIMAPKGSETKIRTDFATIEKEIVEKYLELPKPKRNKFLRRLRQISKYNRTHSKKEKKEEK